MNQQERAAHPLIFLTQHICTPSGGAWIESPRIPSSIAGCWLGTQKCRFPRTHTRPRDSKVPLSVLRCAFSTLCTMEKSELGPSTARECATLCFSRSHKNERLRRKRRMRLFSRVQKVTGTSPLFAWVRTCMFSFKRQFVCGSAHCQNLFS